MSKKDMVTVRVSGDSSSSKKLSYVEAGKALGLRNRNNVAAVSRLVSRGDLKRAGTAGGKGRGNKSYVSRKSLDAYIAARDGVTLADPAPKQAAAAPAKRHKAPCLNTLTIVIAGPSGKLEFVVKSADDVNRTTKLLSAML